MSFNLEILGAGLVDGGRKVRVRARASIVGEVDIDFEVPKFLQQADLLARYAKTIREMQGGRG